MKEICLSGKWKLKGNNYEILADVPGDIANSLFVEKIIEDPYFGRNYEKSLWIQKSNWTYEKEFFISKEDLINEIFIQLEGIDTFSDIYINNQKIGFTNNMHLLYEFCINKYLTEGKNTLRIKMYSVYDKLGTKEQEKYSSVFNKNRIYIRKAQCHFGWDWAPKFPGYGIYRNVNLLFFKQNRLKYINFITKTNGDILVKVETFKNNNTQIELNIYDKNKLIIKKEFLIEGNKKFINFSIPAPKLWWPNGYGEQNLYNYEAILKSKDEILDIKKGEFGIREIRLDESPLDENNLDFCFYINNKKIFARGSNWVPAECMTGTITNERYNQLISDAKEANFNMLRIWGGGIYESDYFYQECDRQGIMIWQDIMFACSEIPDDVPEFVEEIKKELEYQIIRLNNYPSLVYWCGMNEPKGSFHEDSFGYGEFLTNYVLRGMIDALDGTRPYRKSSPFSFSKIENDKYSGDCHNNLSELCLFGESFKGFEETKYEDIKYKKALFERIRNYSLYVEKTKNNFSSECAVLGGCCYDSLKKFIPQQNMDIKDDIFKERFLGNPYTYVMPSFIERQVNISEALFGEIKDIKDFCKKIDKAQLDIMRTEIVYARSNGRCNGFLNWMYNDIWPTGTWSVIDYYLEKKPAFYVMKRCFKSILVDFIKLSEGIELVFVNNSDKNINIEYEIYEENYNGKSLNKQKGQIILNENQISKKLLNSEDKYDIIYCKYIIEGRKDIAIYDKNAYLAHNYLPKFSYKEECDYTDSEYHTNLIFKAETFTPCVAIFAKGGILSDNYFDMVKGQEKTVKITSKQRCSITVKSFMEIWDE